MKKEGIDMALKCPECGTVAHARTSAYEAPSVKRSWYQCQNLECSCTFTALESVDMIIMKPHKPAAPEPESQSDSLVRQPHTLGRYGSACTLKDRHAQ
ncbi:ogr/Delta-like zinc finger family protein [Escherichia coli]|nr:ogr/Delta-like zinc finger family protein [Escherichia coli]EJD7926489.1 ogr/Delta-like zinc finger family protein [Escherichia coli]EJD7931692.1 ogr/Delta-like zinc finger family protein [Escherichia coli]EJE0094197.1 ogr/Delta-like zinc finger family protein [Escherichia coli]EJE0098562.1 ogr/Delta-like zinc finger family protein [Escherichia coli]